MDEMRDLAYYFGRTAFQKEVANQYESIINKWSQSLFDKVIKYCRDSEHITDFPTPFEMDRIGRKLYQNLNFNKVEYEDCYYCQGTGFIPSIVHRKGAAATTENYTCKCTAGTSKDFGVPYFDKFSNIEFKERIDGYSYPQIVNKEYQELAQTKINERKKNNAV